MFRRHCYAAHDPYESRHRLCLSDEHYVATLLAARGRARPPPCEPQLGGVTWALWRGGQPHPHTYAPADVTPALLAQMRGGDGCDPAWVEGALASHAAAFVAADWWAPDVCAAAAAASGTAPSSGLAPFQPMPPDRCHLFARKARLPPPPSPSLCATRPAALTEINAL